MAKKKKKNIKKKKLVNKKKKRNTKKKTNTNKKVTNTNIKKKNNIKKDNKTNKKKLIYNILIVVLLIIVIISFILLIKKNKEEKETIKEIQESILVKPKETEDTQSKSVKEEITDLQKKYNNKDVIGILSIDDEIYTPVAQSKDNQYYLKYSLSKKRSAIGSTFMDYRLNKDSKQINIYGHNHSNKKYNPPFKTLENYLKKDYFENHKYIELKIDNEIQKYEIFSIVIGEKVGTEEHMNIKYNSDNEWLKHFNRLKNRSIYKTNVKLNKEDKIIILQTCLFGKYRNKLMLVVGKRIN